ncbi:hypothetical protein FA13DRAFT_49589 [Coprinellus micaceus]|uniref:C3H1-type domain-containing protein n=1 Tax=Coprinellus micaceus TaxID=71717 RepID=A0A4Y7U2M3_COPMI|nr:hypothetical protein FA13DRAFT_49589 [Coprinellus micaceus]
MNPMEHPQMLSSPATSLFHSISKKPPPLHKRHTKPCKYYQTSKCPYSADVCNFAHVLAPPIQESKSGVLCRHYAAGQCPDGARCRYRHPDDGEGPPPYKPDVLRVTIPDSQPGWNGTMPHANDKVNHDPAQAYSPGYSHYYPQHPHDWSYANGITVHSPVYVYGHPAPSGVPHAVTHPISKGRHHPVAGLGAGPRDLVSNPAQYVSPTAYASDQDDGLSTGSSSSILSTSPSTESDELIIATTEDPKYPDHPHDHQSQVLIAEHSGAMVHIPQGALQQPFYHTAPRAPGPLGYQHRPPIPVLGPQHQGLYFRTATPVRYGSATPRSASNPASRSASRNSHRSKSAKYKTKPCKYWAQDGTCPSGDECTFRHDEPFPPPVPPLPPNLDQLPYSAPRHQLPPQSKAQVDHSLLFPPGLKKDVSQSSASSTTTDNSKKDSFVPIAWRVIGGGVRIGNPYNTTTSSQTSESGPDSAFASDSEDQEGGGADSSFAASDMGLGPVSPVSRGDRSGVAGDGETARDRGEQRQTNVDSGGGRDRAESGASTRSARKRSNSIPPTPSSTQFIVGNLFSAESPGVL